MTRDDDRAKYVLWQNFVWVVIIVTGIIGVLSKAVQDNAKDIQTVSTTVSELKGGYGQIEKSLERIEKKIESIK